MPYISSVRLFPSSADLETDRTNEIVLTMHPTQPFLYAFRLSLSQGGGSAIYKSRNFDRGAQTTAIFLATIGLSMSMFSLKQMQSTHQRRLRRVC
ncbi:hypothetical protein CAJAP_05698 [Camponotus japonicus]